MQIIILGMHRSGTSSVARLINLMGAYFAPEGKEMAAKPDNPQGFWEREDVMQLNDEILQTAGGTWDLTSELDFNKIGKDQKENFHKRIQSIVTEMDAHRPWFLKDPRMCLLLPFWLPFFDSPVFLFVHRNPIQIAQSLSKRNSIPLFVGIALWEYYLASALNSAKDAELILARYEDIMSDPLSEVRRLHDKLQKAGIEGLSIPNEKEITSFITPELFHNRDNSSLYLHYLNSQQLKLIDVFENKLNLKKSSEFEISKSSFDILQNYFLNHDLQGKLTASNHSRNQLRTELESALTSQKKERDDARNELSKVQSSLDLANNALVETKKQVSLYASEIEELQNRITEVTKQNSQLQENLSKAHQVRQETEEALTTVKQELDDVQSVFISTQDQLDDTQNQLTSTQNQLKEAIVDQTLLQQANATINKLRLSLLRKSSFGDLSLLTKVGDRFNKIPGFYSMLETAKSKIQSDRVDNIVKQLAASCLFDKEYYLKKNPDVANSGMDPLKHFVIHGVFEGRRPNSLFDPLYYLQLSPDVMTEGINPLLHYCLYGWREGRNPSSEFNTNYYLHSNSDVRESGLNPLRHYLFHGKGEGRLTSPQGEILSNVPQKLSRDPLSEILFVGHDGIQAGSEVVLLEVVRWFFMHTRKKLKVLLLSPGILADEYAKYADIFVIWDSEVAVTDNELSVFLDRNFDFIYLNTVVSGKFFAIYEKIKKRCLPPIVSHIHEMEKVIETFREEFDYLKQHVDLWISASPATTEDLNLKYQIPLSDISTVEAFIRRKIQDVQEIPTFRSETRAQLGISDDAIVVVGCGTVYWRKGPDIFLNVARSVVSNSQKIDIVFLWIGGGPDLNELRQAVNDEKLDKEIVLIGESSDAPRLISAGNIFFLSSREDPFPLVCLEAAQYKIPTVCFGEATGIKHFVKNDAGIVLNAIDEIDAEKAIYKLALDDELRNKFGFKAEDRLKNKYTSEIQIKKIYSSIWEKLHLKPSVSVIVPNYNHEKFLDERITSIINQSIKDIEIIILDDCSTDNSLQVIQKYEEDPRVKVIANEKNSGSPFPQWNKGINISTGNIIWIAESDDSCENNFLEILLPEFDDELLVISAARTEVIDQHSNLVPNSLDPYLAQTHPTKFNKDYKLDGFTEVNQGFGALCTLVNASGLLMKKSALKQALPKALSFKMCGDWMIYLDVLRHGKISYKHDAVNYFRRHTDSVVHAIEGTETYFRERFNISRFVTENFYLEKELLNKMFATIDHEWERFLYKNEGKQLEEYYPKTELKRIFENNTHKTLHVGFYVHGMMFSKGGIERLCATLANELCSRGHKVTIFCRIWGATQPVYSLAEVVNVVPVFSEEDVENGILALRTALIQANIDVFVPMLSEWLFEPVIEAAQGTGIPVVASEHNDPEKIIELWWDKKRRIDTYEKVQTIHLLLEQFRSSLPDDYQSKIRIIPNGIYFNEGDAEQSNQREKRIISVGRLAKQKRMDRLIRAFSLIANKYPDWTVDIFGEGEERNSLQNLITQNSLSDRVFLRGQTDTIHVEYLKSSIFVLPSEFEGFGIVILEAKRASLPCIAYADCNGPNEIIIDGVDGILVPTSRDEISGLADAMERLITDDEKRSAFGNTGFLNAKKFNIKDIVDDWEMLLVEKKD